MNKREIELAAQKAVAAAEAGMDAVEAALDEHIEDILNVLGPEEAAHWLRCLATSIEHFSDCEGEA